jgi:hypothetical protein
MRPGAPTRIVSTRGSCSLAATMTALNPIDRLLGDTAAPRPEAGNPPPGLRPIAAAAPPLMLATALPYHSRISPYSITG